MRGRSVPLFAFALAAVAVAMLMPAAYAAMISDWKTARSFLFGALAAGFAAAILGVALSGRPRLPESQGELMTLLSCWLFLPVFCAIPLGLITPQIGPVGAWFEMVAAFTTTGGTLYGEPASLPMALHLWRGLVGWLGGLLTLTAAYAILAPRRLGGFEVLIQTDTGGSGSEIGLAAVGAAVAPVEDRIWRALRNIVPVYGGLTLILAFIFNLLGKGEIAGTIHAMAILSTSGITPFRHGFATTPHLGVEMVAAVFMVLAATRLVYARASQIGSRPKPWKDPELRMMAALVGLATVALFFRHWLGALTVVEPGELDLSDAFDALWGGFFTALSFLTTIGLESGYWETARNWSGLANPSLVLLGLCAIGGGAATTAGGIKLIRSFALTRHAAREVDRLSQPLAVMGVGREVRSLLQHGAFIAWIFVMLYILAIFAVTLGLTASGMTFQDALIGAISALTNTGPALMLVGSAAAPYELLESPERIILAAGMILGRIETLALVALLSPDAWRAIMSRKKSSGKPGVLPSESRW